MMGGKIKLLKKKRTINWAFLISPATLTSPRRFKHFCYCFFFFLYLFLCYITLSWWCMYIEEALHVLIFRIMRWGGGACGPKESWHLEIHETGKRRSYQISESEHLWPLLIVSQRDHLQWKPGEASVPLPTTHCFNDMPHVGVTWPPNPSLTGSSSSVLGVSQIMGPSKSSTIHEMCHLHSSSDFALTLSHHLCLGESSLQLTSHCSWNLGDHSRMCMACRDPNSIRRATIAAESTGCWIVTDMTWNPSENTLSSSGFLG